MNIMKKERSSNFELMRIISMFFIVVYHFLLTTGGQLITHTTGLINIFFVFLSLIIIVHVNSFIIVSGYFQYDKKVSIKKVLSLIGMVWFYSTLIAIIFHITGLREFTFLEVLKIMSPFEYENLWFFKTYIALYLLSPYINILINNLDQKQHRNLLILLIVMYSVIATITNQETFSNTGFSIVHFIFLYILGAYLKKYPIKENIHFKNYSEKKKFLIFLSIFMFMGTFNFLLYEFVSNILNLSTKNTITYFCTAIKTNLYYYQNPILLIQSIAYFLMFETIDIKSKFVNKISSCMFAIYVITENPYVRDNMYRWLGCFTGNMIYDHKIILKMFVCSIIVFVFCVIIDLIRKKFKNIIIKTFTKCKKLKSKRKQIIIK